MTNRMVSVVSYQPLLVMLISKENGQNIVMSKRSTIATSNKIKIGCKKDLNACNISDT
jgi:hypothetical protein